MSSPSANPRVIITCGPSYEPLDQVRRLTNFSTGELGVTLANAFLEQGFQVDLFKGSGATTQLRAPGAKIVEFHTNDDLHALLSGVESRETVSAFLHAAALCDFKVSEAHCLNQESLSRGKISSPAGEIHLVLRPALKLISCLRQLFPSACIVGWKYEVEGESSSALEKGRLQIEANKLNACVVNGPAFGVGFGYLEEQGALLSIPTKSELSRFLVERVKSFQSLAFR